MKPVIFKIVSDKEARAYCPQCKRFIVQLNDDTQDKFPSECPHCKEPVSQNYLVLAEDEEELKDE